MACGCYPIVTDITENQSWIQHQQNSYLVTVDDENQLAEELIWAFKNPGFRIKAIAENRQFIEKQANYSLNMKVISAQYRHIIFDFQAKK
jgi:glycosyltransferase involved in cell wall biosynthesis